MLQYRGGNLFTQLPSNGANIVIPHVVNNANAWGSGFVLAVSQYFPAAEQLYKSYKANGNMRLGGTDYVSCDRNGTNIIIVNMCAQTFDGVRNLKYGALCKCMDKVAVLCRNLPHATGGPGNFEKPVEIHAPQFGAGLAGGKWEFIECLIEEIWHNFNVTVYKYENKQSPTYIKTQ